VEGDEETATSAMPRKTVKPDIPMLLERCSGLFAMAIPAGRKRQSDHEAQKTEAEIGEERGEYCGPSVVCSSGPATHLRPPPAHSHKKEAPVVEELWRLSFKGMANELEKPTG
jgi:hypothetical protein